MPQLGLSFMAAPLDSELAHHNKSPICQPTGAAKFFRICTKCHIKKLLGEFHIDKRWQSGVTAECKICNLERQRAKRKAHPEEVAAYFRAWRKANPNKARAIIRAWRGRNRQAYNAIAARHRAQKKAVIGADHTNAVHIRLRWEMFGNKCWICGKPATATDHVKPLARGGAHLPCNLRPICNSCNSRKQAIWPFIGFAF